MKQTRTNNGPQVGLAFIRCKDMTPSHEFQRERKQAKVENLAKNWDDHRVGALIVNVSKINGVIRIRISDGGHRWEGAIQRFGEDYELPCVVNEDLDAEEESGVFLGVNRDRSAVGKWDEFRVGLNGGHEPYTSIQKTLQARGLDVGQKAGVTRVGAVQALIRVENTCGINVLGQTFDVLIRAFTPAPTSWDADMIQAVARLLNLNRKIVDVDRLVARLTAYSVVQWRAKAAAATDSSGGSESRSIVMADVIAGSYNTRLAAAKKLVSGRKDAKKAA